MVARRILEDGTIEPIDASSDSGDPSSGPRIISSQTQPSTTGWSAGDLWFDWSSATTTVEGKWRVWDSSNFLPPPDSPLGSTVAFSDDFSGPDGAAWNASKWGLGRNTTVGTGADATLLSGKGRLQTSNVGNYNGGTTISRRALISDMDDVSFVSSVKFDATECFFFMYVRHNTTLMDGNSGYLLELNKSANSWHLGKVSSYTETVLGTSQPFTFVAGSTYRARIKVAGNLIKARVWNVAVAEPGTWDVEVTDSTFSSPGKTGVSLHGGAAASSSRVFLDDVVITDF